MKPDDTPSLDAIVGMFEMLDKAMDRPHPLDPMDEAKETRLMEEL